MQHVTATTAANYYLYNGKELNKELGLDWYDYGARWYDGALGRFGSVDPSAYRYSSWSSYHYSYNNPILFVDPDGRNIFKAFKVIKRGHRLFKRLKKQDKLTVENFTKGLKDEGLSELVDIAGDVLTLFDSSASLLDKGKAIIDLGTFTELNNKNNKAVEEIFNGTSGGKRSGKPFTRKGKKDVKDENRQKNNGDTVCEGCETKTTPAQQSKKGVSPSGDETRVDHKNSKDSGGDGSPPNGQVLCDDCNNLKSNNSSVDEMLGNQKP